MDALSSYIDHTAERDHAMQAARTIFKRRDVILDIIKKRHGTELDEKYARLAEADILMLFALLLWETNESIKLYNEDESDNVPVPHTYDYLSNLLDTNIDGVPVYEILKASGFQLFNLLTPTAFDIILKSHPLCDELRSLFEEYIAATTLEEQGVFLTDFVGKSKRGTPVSDAEELGFVDTRVKNLYDLCIMVLPDPEQRSTPQTQYIPVAPILKLS